MLCVRYNIGLKMCIREKENITETTTSRKTRIAENWMKNEVDRGWLWMITILWFSKAININTKKNIKKRKKKKHLI